jgi:hypothetical protein
MYSAIGVEPTKLTAARTRVGQEHINGLFIALHHVEHAVRQAGLFQQLRQREREKDLFPTVSRRCYRSPAQSGTSTSVPSPGS